MAALGRHLSTRLNVLFAGWLAGWLALYSTQTMPSRGDRIDVLDRTLRA